MKLNMKQPSYERLSTGSKKHKSFLSIFVPAVFLLSATVFFGSALIITDHKERFSAWKMVDALLRTKYRNCQARCLPKGSEALPRGIAASTSDFQMRPLWGTPSRKRPVMNLLAMTVGTKQKANADKIVKKFLSSRFVVMLFHYDGNVDDWRDLEWCDHVIHVSAINQTKWWFAKRFLHPDIVSEYPYIFLWDEDLGIEHFDVGRYLSIVKKEGLEISQPALDPVKSEIHHQLTARVKGAVVHRTSNVVLRNGKKCDVNSTQPPCAGFVEMMAPVFSRASWRCTWYLIQNDFVHGWGMDYMLGYCAQGDRMKNIGIVDSEYVIHGGVPTLGGTEEEVRAAQKAAVSPKGKLYGERALIRKQQVVDQDRFKRRWNKAIEQDECWVDPYSQKSEFKR